MIERAAGGRQSQGSIWADFGAGSRAPRCKTRGPTRPSGFQPSLLEPVVEVGLGRAIPLSNELVRRAVGQKTFDLRLEGIELTFPRIVGLEIPKIRDLSVG